MAEKNYQKILNHKASKYLLFVPLCCLLISMVFLVYLSGIFIAFLFKSDTTEYKSDTHYYIQEEKKKNEITEVEKVISKIIEKEANNSDNWISYSNNIYGYSFKYPVGMNVRELPFKPCEKDGCMHKGDVAVIGGLNISSYHSTDALSFAYTRGFDENLYRNPVETNIGGIRFYYIITQQGKVEKIVYDYKYLNGLLWIKEEYKVEKGQNSYYVSFGKGILPVDIEVRDIDDLNKVLNTFKF